MEKIKQFLEREKGKDILIVVIVILVGLGSFELGRLSKENANSGIRIEYPNQTLNQPANVISSVNTKNIAPKVVSVSKPKIFFASNRGRKYYPLGCSAGKTIKQENRIYFDSREEAERAGYELSSSCK
jgi:hypothetical protein